MNLRTVPRVIRKKKTLSAQNCDVQIFLTLAFVPCYECTVIIFLNENENRFIVFSCFIVFVGLFFLLCFSFLLVGLFWS